MHFLCWQDPQLMGKLTVTTFPIGRIFDGKSSKRPVRLLKKHRIHCSSCWPKNTIQYDDINDQ